MGLPERTGSDNLPTRIIVRECGLRLDGGTITLMATDEAGRRLYMTLVTTVPGSSAGLAGRLYLDGHLVPMRSEREAQILRLLSEAAVQVPRLPARGQTSQMAIGNQDIKEFFRRTPEENCRAFIRKIVESVQSEAYVRLTTAEEKALEDEAHSDEWERPSTKKKRRPWRRDG